MLRTKNFKWELDRNFGYIRNCVHSLGNVENQIVYIVADVIKIKIKFPI